ncbi:glutathione transferase [Aspergillus sclerotiicarbonarius CBS 121057]|uniref:glutathione transferase n=1 Tax=Aspergillus sclerotiicarbonarius (strain CBS 121057 / IBT 28362) TaxID=1448318 RepID=A0A319ETM9_ASPSB|nr:glutathione transferase [Aspergillus sclerotiicarbonarius CBS 121057]
MTKPITVWLTPSGPNPWKVITILEELQVPYTTHSFKFDDVKKPPFTNINPNGRVPAIIDPNTNLTLWESGAIIQYLIEVYDTKRLLTYDTLPEKHLLNQYLHFQMSGQGPYYGQCRWFNFLYPTKIPTAIDRYVNEVHRILGVLNTILEGKTWLVGEKCTFADLAFVPWNCQLHMVLGMKEGEPLQTYPNVRDWHARMVGREAWKKAMMVRRRLMMEQGLEASGMPKGVRNIVEYVQLIAKGETEGEGEGESGELC